MHVIANSDTAEDQALKLKVRDAVLETGKTLFDGSMTAADAELVLDSEKAELQKAAETVIRENGFDYGVRVEIGKDFFNTRTYDEKVTLPAGTYEAVRVIIGEGAGQNWWCVVFPPLCAAASAEVPEAALAAGLSPAQVGLITEEDQGYVLKSKLVEFWQSLENTLE